jgi:endonuclease/exonuclease/phosphatase family metal-dependent hydrolase
MTPVPDPVPAPTDCRVVTYNVLYAGAEMGGPAWEHRRDAVVGELARLSPDIVALQEVWLDQLPELQAALPEFSWVAVDDTQQHTPIAYRSDAFDLLDRGSFWLVGPETEPGRPGWDGSYQRLVTHATLQDRSGGPALTVMSVHLDHEGERARREGVTLVRDRLEDCPGSEGVVAGDFNCRPGSVAYERATADRPDGRSLRDAAAVADSREGPPETYTGLRPEDDPQNIDHVLVTGGLDVERVVTCVPPAESASPPSDHRPVLADIRF